MNGVTHRDPTTVAGAFASTLLEDSSKAVRALYAAVIYDCPGAVQVEPAAATESTWSTPVDDGGAATVRVQHLESLSEVWLTVKVADGYFEKAVELHDRLVRRAKDIVESEARERRAAVSRPVLRAVADDDLPF